MSTAPTQNRLPKLSIIVAMTEDRVIGAKGKLPWNLPEDLQLFKRLTMGGTIIMGRKTHESIGRPLPGRHNIVLSRSYKQRPGITICKSFISALAAAARIGAPTFIIGGEHLYRKVLPIATELHISHIKKSFNGDRFFPLLDLSEWLRLAEEDYPEFSYVHYLRVKAG